MARTYTNEAVLTLVACLDDPRHKVAAAVALLDRGWGRPTQPIAGDEDRPLAIEFTWAPASPAAVMATIDGEADTVPEALTIEWESC